MKRSQRTPFLALLGTLLLPSSPALCFSQNLPHNRADAPQAPGKPSLAPCIAADLDASIQAAVGPNALYTIAFNYRNISGHDCVLVELPSRGYMAGPFQFGPSECDGCVEQVARHHVLSPLILKKSEFAHRTFSWKTEPKGGSGFSCMEPDWAASSLDQNMQHVQMLECPALLRRICSPVDIGRYTPGVFREDSVPASDRGPSIELLQDSKTFYPAQQIEIEADTSNAAAQMTSNQNPCPVMLQHTRSPDGNTRWVWLGGKRCTSEHTVGDGLGRQNRFRVDATLRGRFGDLGDYSLSLIQVIQPGESGVFAMVESNTIHLTIVPRPRHWGPELGGIAVDITLDKHTYELGEDIPLLIALENFSADVSVIGMTPLWDPGSVVTFEVRDVRQNQIKSLGTRFVMGHGRWLLYPKGVMVPMEQTLKDEGLLPAKAGTYTLTVTWSPHTYIGSDCGQSGGVRGQPYATVQDTETFEIADNNHHE